MFYFATAASALYIALIPESPRYLFMKDPNSQEGIKVLNYIAWFNGSMYRVPNWVTMDIIGQVVQENETINETKEVRPNSQMDITIEEDNIQLEDPSKKS